MGNDGFVMEIAGILSLGLAEPRNREPQPMHRTLFLAAIAAMFYLSAGGTAAAGDAAEQGAERARIADWRNLKFGLMIHWGLYRRPAACGRARTSPATTSRSCTGPISHATNM